MSPLSLLTSREAESHSNEETHLRSRRWQEAELGHGPGLAGSLPPAALCSDVQAEKSGQVTDAARAGGTVGIRGMGEAGASRAQTPACRGV